MTPQRTLAPGPLPETTTLIAKKNCCAPKFQYKTVAIVPRSEPITIHTTTAKPEQEYFFNAQNHIYKGKVNLLSMLETTKGITSCKYTEDAINLAVGFNDGSIRLFDSATGNCVNILGDNECRIAPSPVTALKNRHASSGHPTTNTLIASYENGTVKCWKYKYEQCLYTIREKRQTLGLCYHPRHSKIITYGDDGTLNMYDEEVRIQERLFAASQTVNWTKMDGHRSRIYACSFHPKSNHEFVSGGWDDTVYCWDDRQPFAVGYFGGVHMCGEGLAFNKSGSEILTCSWQENNNIQLWDYGSRKLIDTIIPDDEPCKLFCGNFIAQMDLMVCGGSDINFFRVVDLKLKTVELPRQFLYTSKESLIENKGSSNILLIFYYTKCCIANNPGPITAFDFGRIRKKKKDLNQSLMEIQNIPIVSYISGNAIITVDFG